MGVNLISISPQMAKFSRMLIKEWKIEFPLLTDEGNLTAEDYGLVYTVPDDLKEIYLQLGIDLPRYNGDESWTLPMPARFVIDKKRIIRWASVSPDHTVRPDPKDTLDFLKRTDLKNTDAEIYIA